MELQENLPKKSAKKKAVSFLRGKSFCPKCKHTLAWYDLAPIFSFLSLKGKCRYCKKKISWQYLIVEAATGLLFLAVMNYGLGIMNYEWWSPVFTFNLSFLVLNSCFFILIFIYDLRHYIIPDKFIFSAIGIVVLFRIFEFLNLKFVWNLGFGIWDFQPFWPNLFLALIPTIFFFLLWFLSKGSWLGFGDVKLALLMGLFLGWPNILAALFFAFILGSIIGLVLIVLGKKKMKSQVPFGPFLIAGTFFALFWGEKVINWYLNFIT